MNINTFRAFSSRNYRLFFTGQSVSLIGTWMQQTAVSWLIYVNTHSEFMLGLSVFAGQFPTFLLSPLGGVVSDRYKRHQILLFVQAAAMLQALVLAVLVISKHYTTWQILALNAVLGIVSAFDVPARQSLTYDMVDNKSDLPNALALNASMVNLARLVGPALSGIVLQQFGAGVCFSLNAASFMVVIISLLLMKFPENITPVHKSKMFLELTEGLGYLKRTPAIGMLILMLACVSLLVLPFMTLLPVYAKVIFKGDAATFGYLNSAIGLGAIAGAIFLASLKTGTNLKNVLFINTVIFGIGLILFSHLTNLPLALLLVAIAGFGMMSQTTLNNTIIQTTVANHMRGRVTSYFAMAFFGMLPLGSLLVGSVSQYWGAPDTILAEGVAAIIIALAFLPFFRKGIVRQNA